MTDRPADAYLDGCDLDLAEDPTPDDEVELLTLFAEALDPDNPATVEGVAAMWHELAPLFEHARVAEHTEPPS